ncbi:MAG: LysM peptidoglycan-binding domain-containing protein [Anaerolineales bacterium]|nr:LysM peptidoglycan-binding domain-containing protein [Anaerolineales bacterium]
MTMYWMKAKPAPFRWCTEPHKSARFLIVLVLAFLLAACERPDPAVTVVGPNQAQPTVAGAAVIPARQGEESARPTPIIPEMIVPTRPSYAGTPTPDAPHETAVSSGPVASHFVGAGETLGYIAQIYGATVEELLALNQLDPDAVLLVGQEVLVPSQIDATTPNFKIIPDSELVYGPAAQNFDVRAFAESYGGYLLAVTDEVEGVELDGPEIVQLVADRFSVNPRLLLALLEHRAGWLTKTAVSGASTSPYLLGYEDETVPGLYLQLSRAANLLNWGYYGRSEGGITTTTLDDGARLAFAADINNGTAGVQNVLGSFSGVTYESWQRDVGPDGLFATYNRLFGNPFAFTVDPLWPADLRQPLLQLPWDAGETWYFTGGPHGGWASGSAWAAIDFAPPAEELGCVVSDAWVTAMADGLVVRSDKGAVVVDLDEDGFAGTGWAILYMHLETRDRIPVGTFVQTGDRLGHPSCEGGFSNGTHVHVARLYNGRWVSADGAIPLELAGWVTQGLGREYDGLLSRGGVDKEACACREEGNAITSEP